MEADGLIRRHRSIDPEYMHLIVREYPLWTLMVGDNQNYVGRMIIWLVREGTMQRKSQLTEAELLELAHVEREAEHALDRLFKPGHINYAWLGNLFHMHGGHGHEHIIPRYPFPVRYRERNYIDSRWGHDYHVPGDKYVPTPRHLCLLRDDIISALPPER